jgi:uncharacterized UPF0146 family protein
MRERNPRHPQLRPDKGVPVFADDIASSNYPVFKGPATLYVLRMMPDGIAFVLTSSNEHGAVPSAKKRFPVPNRTG